ncbi:Glutathione-regulated potassium-efflux system protein KefC [Candidatus Entotheonellaceae bacterium PAL068K]
MLLLRFGMILAVFVVVYSVLFHAFMAREGRELSWVTGVYWTLTTMSTLGLGDITFTSDAGRIFTMCVLVSGVVSLLVLLPLLFMEGQSATRVLRELPKETSGHVVLSHYDAVTSALISRLTQYHYPYVLLIPELSEALRLHDVGLKVVLGAVDHPDTFRHVRVDKAALVATTASDKVNTNVAFTVREVSRAVPIIATANRAASVALLGLADCSRVLQFADMLGQSLARRISGGDAMTHVIGQFERLRIAEATAAHTPLVGKSLGHSRLREQTGLSVVGVWERGRFETAGPETFISPHTVLLLAGSERQLQQYDALFSRYNISDAPVVILGGGRVGRATGRALEERGLDYRIVEQLPERVRDPGKTIIGNATEWKILEKAGTMKAPTVVITTHDDDLNLYLTLYSRRLRPDIRIISRATLEHNVPTLHRAGADFVMSYASMGANTIFNLLERSDVLMVTEGLNVFKVPIPSALVGKMSAQTSICQDTGCNLIALNVDDTMHINPDPSQPLPAAAEVILIGTAEAETRFLQLYGKT